MAQDQTLSVLTEKMIRSRPDGRAVVADSDNAPTELLENGAHRYSATLEAAHNAGEYRIEVATGGEKGTVIAEGTVRIVDP